MHPDQPALARRLADRVGRIGVWTFLLDQLPASAARSFTRELEALGFAALWIPEAAGSREAFSHAGLLLGGSERLVVATGIANIWARDPVAMASGARTLGEAYPGRFSLGLGVSHAPAVAQRGGEYRRPVEHMRGYLAAMDGAGFRSPEPSEPVPRVLAALGPRMLRLARERAAGAHPYFVPVEHTRRARQELGPEPLLAVEQAVVLESDAARARQVARGHTQRYLQLANYANNLRRLGWGEPDLADGGSDRLVDAIVAWGAVEALRERLRQHLAAGADHVCVQVLPADGSATTALEQLRLLAPARLGLS